MTTSEQVSYTPHHIHNLVATSTLLNKPTALTFSLRHFSGQGSPRFMQNKLVTKQQRWRERSGYVRLSQVSNQVNYFIFDSGT